MRQHQRRVHRVIFLLVRDDDIADTLTQECFLRAYKKRASFRGECRIETWLLRIAVNLVRDHGKNRRTSFWKKLVRLEDRSTNDEPREFATPQPSPERVLLAREQLQSILSAVSSLPTQQRSVFLLRFAEEMSLAGPNCRCPRRQSGYGKSATRTRDRKVARDEGEAMEIMRHLTNEELTDLALASDQQSLRLEIEALPEWSRIASERADEFWEKQRAEIWSRVNAGDERKSRHALVFASSAAAAIIAIASVMLSFSSREPVIPQARVDSDQELLMTVERVVQSEELPSLQPAALLTREMVQASSASTIRKKGLSHED